ncbi:MAG: tetratricopeptide repeat protein [Acidimicrobiales bacterium]|nr:tetratricopeptide repeat protein [Acidimicrobiales bacterium]
MSDAPGPAARGLDLDELARLEEERDFLLRSLDDLEREHDAGDVDDHDYAALRDDYTHRAAEALRAIDARRAALPARPPARPLRRVLVVAGVVAVALLAGVAVAAGSGLRLPGQSASGDIRDSSAGLLAEARLLLQQGDAVAALERFDEVAESDPGNAEALAYGGWLRHLAGLTPEGLERIDAAIAVDPTYADARFFKGIILRDQGDLQGALEQFDAFLADDPPAGFADQVRETRDEVAARLAAQGVVVPPAPGPTP